MHVLKIMHSDVHAASVQALQCAGSRICKEVSVQHARCTGCIPGAKPTCVEVGAELHTALSWNICGCLANALGAVWQFDIFVQCASVFYYQFNSRTHIELLKHLDITLWSLVEQGEF